MKFLLGLRVVATLFVAVLLPLELSHCALMPLQASAIASAADHADRDGEHDCCRKSGHDAAHSGHATTDPCCCVSAPVPVATTPALVSLDAPTSVHAAFAIVQTIATTVGPQAPLAPLEPDARSGSPPDPATAPQSPRSPPSTASLSVLILT